MNTTYDDIFQAFLDNCKYNPSEIPSDEESMIAMIRNAINIYNSKMAKHKDFFITGVQADDFLEELNVCLSSDELLILSYIIKLVFLKNEYTYFTSVWGVFTKELGLKSYKNQSDARLNTISETEMFIDELIFNVVDDWDV